jgi:hypothetical protein
MSEIVKDNIYPVGMHIAARVSPLLKLKIESYNQRIYYCSLVDEPERKQFAYFERELIAPLPVT